jgi:diketogulonate reductase-like aldo/keto reductase
LYLKQAKLRARAERYEKTQAQVALNWLISQKKIIAMPKTTNINHIKETVGLLVGA